MIEQRNDMKETVRLFKALADGTRLRLVRLLADQLPHGAMCVGALARSLGISQSAVSQHLAILKAAGLVVDERRGYYVHYRLERERLISYLEDGRRSLIRQ